MKFRFGRSLTLLVVFGVACPAAVLGADRDQSQPSAGEASTSIDKAAEAERLANLANALPQRAAFLAAESQDELAPAKHETNGATSSIESAQHWTTRESKAIFITDDAHDSHADRVSLAGWRTPSNGPADANIKFMDDNLDTAAAEADDDAEAKQPADSADATLPRAELIAERLPPIQQDERPPSQAAETQESEPKVMSDDNVQLASRMFAEDDLPAGLNEAPSAVPPYDDKQWNEGEPIVRRADYGSYDSCGCGDTCCDGCSETECCPPQRVLFWTAGVEATFLFPDINSEGASFLVEEAAETRSDWISTITEDVDSMYVSPRIWLGVQGCKWGANLRYWHMHAGEGAYDPTVDPGGGWGYGSWLDTGFSTSNHLEAYTIDLEITRRFCLNDCWMQASAGVRHAEIEQNESIWGTALTDDATLFGVARANRLSRGTGVVLGLYGRKPLFPRSCVHWFYNVRWSTMWGPTETSAETGVLLAANPGMGVVANAGSNNGASTWANDTLYIGEIQLGLEWNYALQCLPANAFFRAAIEYQRWDGGVGYSSATSFASVEVDGVETTYAETNAAAAGAELDLVGITVGTGLTW